MFYFYSLKAFQKYERCSGSYDIVCNSYKPCIVFQSCTWPCKATLMLKLNKLKKITHCTPEIERITVFPFIHSTHKGQLEPLALISTCPVVRQGDVQTIKSQNKAMTRNWFNQNQIRGFGNKMKIYTNTIFAPFTKR